MAVCLKLSGYDPEPHRTPLCNNGGYGRIEAWMKSLPAGKYPSVDAFASDLRYKGTDVLAVEMNDAALENNPPEDGTDELVRKLLDLIGGGYPEETAGVEVDA